MRKGFRVNTPTAIQQMEVQSGPFASKGSTTGLGVDYSTRRISMQITNNKTSPQENLKEILAVIDSIGYPTQESLARIEVSGSVVIKVEGSIKASETLS